MNLPQVFPRLLAQDPLSFVGAGNIANIALVAKHPKKQFSQLIFLKKENTASQREPVLLKCFDSILE